MVYIGMTGRKPNERWRNGEGYKHNEHFARAIEKYGWDSFSHDVLWTGVNREVAEQKEIELIALHKSNNRAFGYNIESGGRLNVVSEETRAKMRVAITGKKASEETRQKLSEAHKGKRAAWLDSEFQDEIKKKISNAKKGEKNGMYGKNVSEETKQRISENNARYWSGKHRSEETKQKLRLAHSRPYNKHKRPVRCIETGVVYPSIVDAFEQTGVDRAGICLVCNGKRKTSGGYHWEFVS